jgi:hypothetical protein
MLSSTIPDLGLKMSLPNFCPDQVASGESVLLTVSVNVDIVKIQVLGSYICQFSV